MTEIAKRSCRTECVIAIAVMLVAVFCSCANAGELTVSEARIFPHSNDPMPSYLVETRDPLVHVPFVRVTNPGGSLGSGIICSPRLCRHRYSSTQVWNADQSLMVIINGCNGMCFLDGNTFEPRFHRLNIDDCKWHPRKAPVMLCVRQHLIYWWEPRTNDNRPVFTDKALREITFGPYKGRLSADGTRLVVRATTIAGRLIAFVLDLATGQRFPDIDLARLPGRNDDCEIAPSGRLLICFQTTESGLETGHVFTLEGKPVQSWWQHHRPRHGDMAIDTDGSDVYVGISKADPDKWHVIKRRLTDGKVTVLAPAGYATHVSTRNTLRPGWAFLSYEGSREKVESSPGWAPFYREVVAVRIDGSGEVRRIARTHNAKSDYDSETQASPSPDGTRVVWASNWGVKGGPVADYVSLVAWSDGP